MRSRIIVVLFILIFVFIVPMKSPSYGVPADSVEKKHKSTTTCILKQTAIYGVEQLGGLVGNYATGMWYFCMWMRVVIARVEENYWQGFSISMPLTTAPGTWFTGKILKQKGSFTGALIGSTIGTAAWAIPAELGYLKGSEYTDAGSPLWYTSIGSVIGYNYREILKLDACSISGMLLTGVISYALPYILRYLSTLRLP
jgi:hypothetical protein